MLPPPNYTFWVRNFSPGLSGRVCWGPELFAPGRTKAHRKSGPRTRIPWKWYLIGSRCRIASVSAQTGLIRRCP